MSATTAEEFLAELEAKMAAAPTDGPLRLTAWGVARELCTPDRIAILLASYRAQQAEIERLRAAVKPFACVVPFDIAADDELVRLDFTGGDFRRARAALQSKETK